jgi:hypothetical protein
MDIQYLWINYKPCLFILLFAFKNNSRSNISSICCNTLHSCDKLEIRTTKFVFWTLVTSTSVSEPCDHLHIGFPSNPYYKYSQGDIMLFDDCLEEVKVLCDCRMVESLGPFGIQT